MSTSNVADNTGKVVPVQDLTVKASKIHNFVEMHRKAYFEEHSLDWALDEILTRGMAEITRQIKTAAKTRDNKIAGDLLRLNNLTAAQAQELFVKLQAEAAARAKA
jgi:hypothetical protein